VLNDLKDKFVKVVYQDGNKQRALYGILVNEDSNFIQIKYHNGKIVVVNKNAILRVTELKD